jgi:hypothetical protein
MLSFARQLTVQTSQLSKPRRHPWKLLLHRPQQWMRRSSPMQVLGRVRAV